MQKCRPSVKSKTLVLSLVSALAAGVMMAPLALHAQEDNQEKASPVVNGQAIADRVSDELAADMGVVGETIDVSIEDGAVRLNGTTNSLLAKNRATRIARTVRGVRTVINDLSVVPAAMKPAYALEEDVEAVLINDPAADAADMTVQADDDGIVALDGTVSSWQERALAEKAVASVTGVTHVDNNLRVPGADVDRPDSQIEKEIERRLYWDALIDSSDVTVLVDEGAVTLEGSVASAAERRRAERYARITGVRSVDMTGLAVEGWADRSDRRSPTSVELTDDQVARAVEDALAFDPRVDAENITVSARDGRVVLRGRVESLVDKGAAVTDARNTMGVFAVTDRMTIVANETDSDDIVASNLRGRLSNASALENHPIRVDVEDGLARLYGTVDSFYQKHQANVVASGVEGIVRIDHNIDVRNDHRAMGYNPYVDEGMAREASDSYDAAAPTKSDREIFDDLKAELWWSPMVDEEEVTAVVDQGRVILTGTVPTMLAKEAAAKNAWDAGATQVTNRIEVEG